MVRLVIMKVAYKLIREVCGIQNRQKDTQGVGKTVTNFFLQYLPNTPEYVFRFLISRHVG